MTLLYSIDRLTEAEYKLELLEKDPFALDVIQAIGRGNLPADLLLCGPYMTPLFRRRMAVLFCLKTDLEMLSRGRSTLLVGLFSII